MSEITARDLKQRFFNVFSNTDREAQSVLRFLLSAVLQIDYSKVNFHLEDTVSPDQQSNFNEALLRLERGEPIQHIIGTVEFFELQIRVNRDVLIPRPETEELLYWIQEDGLEIESGIDFCTGSGCIALGLKRLFPMASVEGIDLSEKALKTARENSALNKLPVAFYKMDLLQTDSTLSESYDLIVSNPPYIPLREREGMDTKVIEFEPSMALFVADHEPLVFYERIADLALQLLKKEGTIYLELHEDFALETLALYREKGFTDLVLKQDLQGKNRMLRVRR